MNVHELHAYKIITTWGKTEFDQPMTVEFEGELEIIIAILPDGTEVMHSARTLIRQLH